MALTEVEVVREMAGCLRGLAAGPLPRFRTPATFPHPLDSADKH